MQDKPMNCQYSFIILAAGQGTRMKSKYSKVMHKIAGLSMVDYSINLAEQFSLANNISIVSRPDAQDLNEHLQKKDLQICWQNQQLGTADAVRAALDNIEPIANSKTIILYADTPFITIQTIEKLIDNDSDLTCCFFEDNNANRYGRAIIKNNKLQKITEFKDADQDYHRSSLCNSGIMAIDSKLLHKYLPEIQNNNASKEYYLTDLIAIFLKHNLQVDYVVRDKDEFMGINSRHELAKAENLMQQNLRYQLMEQGVTLVDPQSVFLSYDTIIGADSIIYPNNYFGPKVKLGEENIVYSYNYIEHTSSANNVEIGPFAKLRGDSILGENSAIGSFVEAKKASLGEGSKAKHLSYLGDINIGSKVNIGAGTITCNYDGKNKHLTNIDDNSFIGSNSSLIAPLNIGKNCFIAAGSVINRNCSDNQFALSRVKQQNKSNKITIKVDS